MLRGERHPAIVAAFAYACMHACMRTQRRGRVGCPIARSIDFELELTSLNTLRALLKSSLRPVGVSVENSVAKKFAFAVLDRARICVPADPGLSLASSVARSWQTPPPHDTETADQGLAPTCYGMTAYSAAGVTERRIMERKRP